MGRQVRKIAPWGGMFESHLHSNHVIHRLYRWTTYHSHPTNRGGHPFKFRFNGRPYIGALLTPDIIKYKIPLPYAFVSANPKLNPKYQDETEHKTTDTTNLNSLYADTTFKKSIECAKSTDNLRKCLQNNNTEVCSYYLNYVNNFCVMKQ